MTKQWTNAEKWLLPVAVLIAVLFDRLIMANIFNLFTWDASANLRVLHAVFWLCYLAVFTAVFWRRVRHDRVLWFVSACVAALCGWNFLHPTGNEQFALITALVIPGVLMAHAQWTANAYTLKTCGGIVMDWIAGWTVKPFTALGAFLGVTTSLPSEENKPTIKRALLGVGIAAAVLLVVVPLLMGADQVFNYYLGRVFAGFSFGRVIFHGFVIVAAAGLFYSFLWNVGHGKNVPFTVAGNVSIDSLVSSIVLGSVILVYVLFCVIQFTYLFAGAGLPYGMTYAEYAREGFAQTVVVCAINLFLFGIFLRFGEDNRLRNYMMGALLLLTGIMLFSGWVRLDLYISTFGMTWLRMLSAWFILYLAAVIALCAVRLFIKKGLPVLAVSGFVLLVWYVVLGFVNPDGFIVWFNAVV